MEDFLSRVVPGGLVVAGLSFLALAHPPRVGHALALDLDTDLVALAALFAHEVVVRSLAKQMLGEVAALDATALAGRFHPGGEVDGIAKEAITRHLVSDDAGDDRTGGQTGTDEDLLPAMGAVGLDELQGVEGEERHLLGSLGGGAAIGSTADDHVGISAKCAKSSWIGFRENFYIFGEYMT